MSQRSKRPVTTRRCPKCGALLVGFKGERVPCPYKELHKRVAS